MSLDHGENCSCIQHRQRDPAPPAAPFHPPQSKRISKRTGQRAPYRVSTAVVEQRRAAGKARTLRKALAVRANGQKGGRPPEWTKHYQGGAA